MDSRQENTKFLDGLNEEQIKAITLENQSALILAGTNPAAFPIIPLISS